MLDLEALSWKPAWKKGDAASGKEGNFHQNQEWRGLHQHKKSLWMLGAKKTWVASEGPTYRQPEV